MSTEALDDAHFLAQAQQGDEAAFCELVRRHQAVVRAFLGRFVRSAADVDDLAQEVFLAAHRDLATCGDRGLRSWLFTIARHRALTWLRDEERRSRRQGRGFEAQLMTWQADEAQQANADDETMKLVALQHCMEELPNERAELLRTYYREGEDVSSMSRRFSRPASWIKVTMFRLRRALRGCVEGRLARREAAHG